MTINYEALRELQKEPTFGWVDSLQGELTEFKKGDMISIPFIWAWSQYDVWHNKEDLFRYPVSIEEATRILKPMILDVTFNEMNTQFDIVIEVMKEVTSKEIIPLLYTVVNLSMNIHGVSPRQHFVESFNKVDMSEEGNNIYNVFLGT